LADALPVAYLNGRFVPLPEAKISPLDRGFLFGDAIYEVVPVFAGRPLLLDAHLQRLDRSLAELRIGNPHTRKEWNSVISGLTERNGGGNIAVYLQVSRGADRGRDQVFPDGVPPTVFGMASTLETPDYDEGVIAITLPDNRWGRCDIKSTSLLANILARQAAHDAGAIDAILLRDGLVTEAAVSSVIIAEHGGLVRRRNGHAILPGTTTDYVVELAAGAGIECREDEIPEARLRSADEIWLTGATKGIAPVVELDGRRVGTGRPGPLWRRVAPLFEAVQHD